jgi:hypothetical protein
MSRVSLGGSQAPLYRLSLVDLEDWSFIGAKAKHTQSALWYETRASRDSLPCLRGNSVFSRAVSPISRSLDPCIAAGILSSSSPPLSSLVWWHPGVAIVEDSREERV